MDTDERLDALGFFKDGFSICDIGCGFGYIPKYLFSKRRNITYIGLDVKKAAIVHCENRFKNIYGYSFKRLNLHSDTYNPKSSIKADQMVFPIADESIDSIVCHSIFTHLGSEKVAKHYMDEINRVLKKDGLLWTTWFKSPPNEGSSETIRTVYKESFIDDILSSFKRICSGGGKTTGYHDQWEVVCVK